MNLSYPDFIAKWHRRFAPNTTFNIAEADFQEFSLDIVDTFGVRVANVPAYVAGTVYTVGYLVRYTPAGGQEGFYYALSAGPLTAPGPGNLVDWKVVPGPVLPTALSQSLTLSQAQGLDQAGVVAGRDYLIDCGLDASGNTQTITVRGLANDFFDVEGTLEVNGKRTAVTDFKVQAGTWTVKQYSSLTAAQQAALNAANAPSATNPVATLADLSLHFTDVVLLPDANQVYQLPADIRGKRFLISYPAATATIRLPAAFVAEALGAAFCLRLDTNSISTIVPIYTLIPGSVMPVRLDAVAQAGDTLLLAVKQSGFYYSVTQLAATAGDLNTVATTLPLAIARTADYTLQLSDIGALVPVAGSAAVVLTVAAGLGNAAPTNGGTGKARVCYPLQLGTGQLSLVAGGGVNLLTPPGGGLQAAGPGGRLILLWLDTNTVLVEGGI